MVTKIHANVTVDVSSQWKGVVDQNSGSGGSDPVSFGDLNLDDIVILYDQGCR